MGLSARSHIQGGPAFQKFLRDVPIAIVPFGLSRRKLRLPPYSRAGRNRRVDHLDLGGKPTPHPIRSFGLHLAVFSGHIPFSLRALNAA